jgi:DNA helicase-2/ATP-dependent DNA helicase PcrA
VGYSALHTGGPRLDTEELTPIEQAKHCLDNHISFVMQGGAGSGKTEALKDLLGFMSLAHPKSKVICITHTNIAVDEIRERIKDAYPVSTIHSFLYDIIKDYKKNIKSVIHELFILTSMVREPMRDEMTESDYKKVEYEKYKRIYEQYADKFYSISKGISNKVTGKREYDANPEFYNSELNAKIEELNAQIISIIRKFDYSKITYNETKFNSFNDLSYGHDGLLDIAHLLFSRFPVLSKIVSDKYDFIFIDEYQDTRAAVIEDLLKISNESDNFSICLFGDTMQSIYSDGIGDVNSYTESGKLCSIPKSDNYRCSFEVIDLINTLRLDDIVQKVALATDLAGKCEAEEVRHGNVNVMYKVIDQKPSPRSSPEEKDIYLQKVDELILAAEKSLSNAKILLLTNKAIATKEGFSSLYKIFDDRYIDVGDRMDEYLKRTQIADLCDLCIAFEFNNYNSLIKSIKQSGYTIKKVQDKIRLKELFDQLFCKNMSLATALDFAFANHLLKISESHVNLKENNKRYLSTLNDDSKYQEFKKCYLSGQNTYSRMRGSFNLSSAEEFNDYNSKVKKETFINSLAADNIKFIEAINYFKYINEQSKYITMHRTKGSSIDSVIVIMEEFFWTNEYDFSLIYLDKTERSKKRDNSQKLIYVACSRARKNLLCVRLVTPTEEPLFCKKFPMAQKIDN